MRHKELELLIDEIKLAFDKIETIIDLNKVKNCLTCDSWDQSKELCNKYKMLPPLKIIVYGCDTYADEVPF